MVVTLLSAFHELRNTDITIAGAGYTPNTSLPPMGEGPRRRMVITIEVTEDFERRLDNQWMVEREIHADRWCWKWENEKRAQDNEGKR